jgi:PAS domain S-box-containing protein
VFSLSIFRRISASDRKKFFYHLRFLLLQNKSFQFEFRYKMEDGSFTNMLAIAEPVLSDHKETIGYNGTLQDMTERHLLLEQSRRSGTRLLSIVEALPDITFIFDANGRYVDVMVSRQREDYDRVMNLKGKAIQDICSPAETDTFLRTINETIRTGRMQIVEYEFDSVLERKWYEGRTTLMRDVKTGEAKVIWVARDITENKLIREDLILLNNQLEARINERTEDLRRTQLELERELELHKQAADMLQLRSADQR